MTAQAANDTNTHNYTAYATAAIAVLADWYNSSSGLFESTGWWNTANCVNAVIDYSARTRTTTYLKMIRNTFERNAAGKFRNKYYDDEGWWALTWVNAYDLTGDACYLAMAISIFADIRQGWDAVCNGGIWWSKQRNYKNAIPTELFLTLAARLHERTQGYFGHHSYLNWALTAWKWFDQSGMLNAAHLVNDGLNKSCVNNNGVTWTYNQGVILGGLVALYQITGEHVYLERAEAIALAVLQRLVNAWGILVETCEDADCGGDGPQFKGIFMRNLFILYQVDRKAIFRQFILHNADAIWRHNKNAANQFGLHWDGPFDHADAARQSSALDALNAAIPFSSAL